MMKGKLTFLGTGGSVGVPMIGCDCFVCRSLSPFNQRFRSSTLLEIKQKKILIDVSPDFRQQALKHQISHLDGVILTHAHNDHIAGIDDLRPLYFKRETPLPFLLSKETAADVENRFPYIFQSRKLEHGLSFQLLSEKFGHVNFEGIEICYVTYMQADMQVNGFRFGNFVYLTDIREYTKDIWDSLKGVKTLVISALRFVPTPMHFSIDEAIDFASKVQAENVWLTHLSHELDYLQTNTYLPHHIRLAYDGLEIEFE